MTSSPRDLRSDRNRLAIKVSRPRSRCGRLIAEAAVILVAVASSSVAFAHGIVPPSLKGFSIPDTEGLYKGRERVIRNQRAAVALGKALFWDIQVGSDGMACASCHHHAGADGRAVNQLSPGHAPATQLSTSTFEPTAGGGDGGPNYALTEADFPLHQLADPSDITSAVVYTTDDVVGSAGSFGGSFHGAPGDDCDRSADAIFQVQGIGTRRVTSRNAPSIYNAVFNPRLFWDGSANNVFNGVNPFGPRDSQAGIWVWKRRQLTFEPMRLENSALASQAVFPPLSEVEMSCGGRTFADIGRKLLSRQALAFQDVHRDDSVLGRLRDRSGTGLRYTYEKLVRRAFHPRFRSARPRDTGEAFGAPANGGEPYTQMEANFSLFFGLALQAYQATLVSDEAPFDSERRADGHPSALDEQQHRGLEAFIDFHCADCHSGPTLSGAALAYNTRATDVDRKPVRDASGSMVLGIVDTGFHNTSVTPVEEDPGLAATDRFGLPLSLSTQYLDRLLGNDDPRYDAASVRSCAMTSPFAKSSFGQPAFPAGELIDDPAGTTGCESPQAAKVPAPAVVAQELALPAHGRLADGTAGAFKVPSLRNIELTGPYMHNGSMATLEEVVAFYNRAGNHVTAAKDAEFLFSLDLSPETQADLVAFLRSLTDERVRWERAPFDHPSLPLPVGHLGDEQGVTESTTPGYAGLAETRFVTLPAVGAAGRNNDDGPLLPFHAALPEP